jgi:hypothetical protein
MSSINSPLIDKPINTTIQQNNRNKYILIITIVSAIILMFCMIIYFTYGSDDDTIIVANNTIIDSNTNTNTNTNTQFIPSEEFSVTTPLPIPESTNNVFLLGLQNINITQIEAFTNTRFFSNNKNEYFGNIGLSEETPIIIFDSLQKIIDYYDIYIKTYFPLLNYENINNKVRNRTNKSIIQILQEKSRRHRNLNPLSLLRERQTSYKKYMGLVFGMPDQTHFKLLCMSLLILRKIRNPNFKQCIYYPLEDPINKTDFVTYVGECKSKEYVKELHKNKKNEHPSGSLNIDVNNNTLKKISWKDEFLKDLIDYTGYSNEKDNRKIEKNITDYVKSLQSQKDKIISNYEDEIANLIINVNNIN